MSPNEAYQPPQHGPSELTEEERVRLMHEDKSLADYLAAVTYERVPGSPDEARGYAQELNGVAGAIEVDDRHPTGAVVRVRNEDGTVDERPISRDLAETTERLAARGTDLWRLTPEQRSVYEALAGMTSGDDLQQIYDGTDPSVFADKPYSPTTAIVGTGSMTENQRAKVVKTEARKRLALNTVLEQEESGTPADPSDSGAPEQAVSGERTGDAAAAVGSTALSAEIAAAVSAGVVNAFTRMQGAAAPPVGMPRRGMGPQRPKNGELKKQLAAERRELVEGLWEELKKHPKALQVLTSKNLVTGNLSGENLYTMPRDGQVQRMRQFENLVNGLPPEKRLSPEETEAARNVLEAMDDVEVESNRWRMFESPASFLRWVKFSQDGDEKLSAESGVGLEPGMRIHVSEQGKGLSADAEENRRRGPRHAWVFMGMDDNGKAVIRRYDSVAKQMRRLSVDVKEIPEVLRDGESTKSIQDRDEAHEVATELLKNTPAVKSTQRWREPKWKRKMNRQRGKLLKKRAGHTPDEDSEAEAKLREAELSKAEAKRLARQRQHNQIHGFEEHTREARERGNNP